MTTRSADYESASAARSEFKSVLDRAARGRAVTVRRGSSVSAVTDAQRLQAYFAETVSPRAKVFAEDGRWVVLLEQRPFVAEGATVADALVDLVAALREYAEDWEARLSTAPNHESNWALVQLIFLSTDEQLLDWIERGGQG